MICTTPWTSPRKLTALLGVALPLVTQLPPAQAQDTLTNPTTSVLGSDPIGTSGAASTTVTPRSAVTVRPGRSSYVTPDLRTAVVGATEVEGNVSAARRGLAAASAAISVLPGYTGVPAGEVARAMSTLKGDALRLPEYQHLKKAIRADRVLSLVLTPGLATDADATYTAVVELYDTTTGGLVGRGESTFTATGEATTPAPETSVPGANEARGTLVNGVNGTLPERAVDGAVARAVFALNNPVIQRGVVLSKSATSNTKGAPLFARISLGEREGMRAGTPIEYIVGGERVGFGTIVDLGAGEAVATVAPETAFSRIFVNTEVRNVDNPPLARSGMSQRQRDDREFARFEREFGIAFLGSLAAYYLIAR